MISVKYTDSFLRDARRLSEDVRVLLLQQVDRFRDNSSDPRLHAKQLHGRFSGVWSFRVTRNYRVLYRHAAVSAFVLLAVDDRKDVYR